MQYIRLFIIASLSSILYATSVFAAIRIEQPLTFLSEQAKMAQITVFNDSDEKAYIQMEATEQLCTDKNALSCKNRQDKVTADSAKLTFSNPKFILRPQQKKVIYVMWQDELPNSNRMFFINGRDMKSKTTQKISDSNISTGLNIITLYKSRVLVAQAGSQLVKPIVEKEGDTISVRNPGTGPAWIKVQQFCKKEEICEQMEKRLRSSKTARYLGTNQTFSMESKPNFTSSVFYFDFMNEKWKRISTIN